MQLHFFTYLAQTGDRVPYWELHFDSWIETVSQRIANALINSLNEV